MKAKSRASRRAVLRALREAVLRALEIRHGSLPEGIREAVGAVSDRSLLERLHEGTIKAASIEEFAQML